MTPPQGDAWQGPQSAMEVHLPFRNLDSATYGTTDEQFGFGMSFQTRPPAWPANLDLSLFFTGDQDGGDDCCDADVEGENIELSLGLLKHFGRPGDPLRPYVGAGAAYVFAEYDERGSPSGDDADVGAYARAGIAMAAFPRSFWGIDVRVLGGADLDLGLEGTDGDYVQVSIFWTVGF